MSRWLAKLANALKYGDNFTASGMRTLELTFATSSVYISSTLSAVKCGSVGTK